MNRRPDEQVNSYRAAVSGYPDSWFAMMRFIRRVRALPGWLKNVVSSALVLAVGVQTYKAIELSHVSAGASSNVRWDCINGSPISVHVLFFIAYGFSVVATWACEALNSTIFPALGVTLSVAIVATISGGDSSSPRIEAGRWFQQLTVVFVVLLSFIVVSVSLLRAADATHFSCPTPTVRARYASTQKTRLHESRHIIARKLQR